MFKLVNGADNSFIPTIQTKYSGCADIKSMVDISVKAGEIAVIPTGIALNIDDSMMELYKHYHFKLFTRSSLAKQGLLLANGVGIIDIDYQDEIKVMFYNPIKDKHFDNTIEIKKGDRIAQIMMDKSYNFIFNRINKTRDGGFGSTNG